MDPFKLHILGCGSATPTGRHNPSCQVVDVRNNLFMIDCGEGAQTAFRHQHLKSSRLSHIFISHLHGDHCFGLFGFISTLALHERPRSLTIHTFAEGAALFSQVLDYFCRERSFELKFNIIDTHKRVIYEDDAITVTTFPLLHRVPAVGFLFTEKPKLRHINAAATREHGVPQHFMLSLRQGKDYVTPNGVIIPNDALTTPADPSRSYAYCSDTRYSRRVVKAIEGVDWLYHEATYDDTLAIKARKRYHSTASEAARVAGEAGAKNLILGHFSKRYLSEDLLLEQARATFPSTIAANEGLTVDLTKDIQTLQ